MKPLKYLAILVLLAASFFPVGAQNKAEVKVLFNIQEVLRGSDLKAKIDAFKAASKVNIYPAFHLEADSALLPFAMELYFEVRRKCEEPYVTITLNFIPKGKKWTDFSNYGISISLTQGKQKSINPAMLTKAEIEVNKMLANIKNVGTEIATIKKKVEDLIDQLRAFKYRNINMQLPLVNFYPVTGPQASQYGYDRLKYSGMEGEYENFRRYDSTVVVPYKAMPTTGTETFMAVITRGDTATRPDSIRYRNDAGTLVMPTSFPSDTLAIFTLTGAGGDNEFTAYYPVADSTGKVTEVPIGRIILRGYEAENKQLKLVPLATAGRLAGDLSPTTLATYLNGVYRQGAISWTVEPDKAWSPSTSKWDTDGNDTLDIETGIFSRYSGEITKLLDAFTKEHPTVDETYYLFVTNAPNTSGYLGYMPLNGQYGIIFMAATAPEGYYEREAAHELGHGAFGLEHAWKVYPLNQNSTPNLMDYNNGTELWAGQWKYMHEWHLKIGVGQDVEDGAMMAAFDYAKFLKEIKQAYNKKQNFSWWASPSDKVKKLYETKIENISVDGYYFSTIDIKITNLSANNNLIQVNTYSQANISNGILLDNQVEIIVRPNELNALKEYLFNIPNPNSIKAGKILFVNGHWQSGISGEIISSAKALKPYWSSNFEIEAKKYFSETSTYNMYIDGSTTWGGNESGSQRYERGRKWAEDNFNALISNMAPNGTFKIVTHSEGAAFGAGIASYLIQNGKIVQRIVFLSPDEGDEFICPNNLDALQLGYKSCQGFDYKVTKIVLPRHYPYDPMVGDYWIKNVAKYGVVNRDDLLRDYLHGETKGSQVFKELKDLELIIIQQNFDGNGKIFYKQVNTPNNTQFFKYNDTLLQKECN